MAVTAEALKTFTDAAATFRFADESPYASLSSGPEVLAFGYTTIVRDGGSVEAACDFAEVILRSANASASQARRYAATLARVGFVDLAKRLREIVGRRKHTLRPLT
jgi:hypothetical protein